MYKDQNCTIHDFNIKARISCSECDSLRVFLFILWNLCLHVRIKPTLRMLLRLFLSTYLHLWSFHHFTGIFLTPQLHLFHFPLYSFSFWSSKLNNSRAPQLYPFSSLANGCVCIWKQNPFRLSVSVSLCSWLRENEESCSRLRH